MKSFQKLKNSENTSSQDIKHKYMRSLHSSRRRSSAFEMYKGHLAKMLEESNTAQSSPEIIRQDRKSTKSTKIIVLSNSKG